MRLRIRHAKGLLTISDVTLEQSVLELKKCISKSIGLASNQDVEISGGYPPKPISDNTISLKDAGLRDGDTLNIKILDTVVAPVHKENSTTVKEGIVETPTGFLTLRVMDDDNSCLFRSIVVVEGIKSDPITYSDATLGQPRDKYMDWIQKPNAWGGAIELAILSSHFGIEIDSIDVQTGRVDKFGEGKYDERVLIVYSGIHYDALALAPTSDSPMDFDQTRFSVTDEYILKSSSELVNGLRKSHRFTDIANFTLKCEQCNTGLKGEKDAQDHAAVSIQLLLIDNLNNILTDLA
ncbi:hypothetical protein INT47_008412 [Mucor saturninus]|uniref:Ubiquitin thioesterase OTU n=1 Tax=Mucor saturninus TaxID=64648 RepID=A0A8H7RA34_9FUNG|nr:hypothetical protein INT47_008412 [Mucor saturninus]